MLIEFWNFYNHFYLSYYYTHRSLQDIAYILGIPFFISLYIDLLAIIICLIFILRDRIKSGRVNNYAAPKRWKTTLRWSLIALFILVIISFIDLPAFWGFVIIIPWSMLECLPVSLSNPGTQCYLL